MLLLAAALATQISLMAPPSEPSWERGLLLPELVEGGGSGSAPMPFDAGTIVLQSLTGVLGAAVAGLGGIFAGAALVQNDDVGFAALGAAMLGALAGAPIGFGVGVWAGGAIRGHRGSFWATLGTSVAGVGLALVASSLIENAIPVFVLLPATVVGTVWVYHHTDGATRGFTAVTPQARYAEQRPVAPPVRSASLLRVSF